MYTFETMERICPQTGNYVKLNKKSKNTFKKIWKPFVKMISSSESHNNNNLNQRKQTHPNNLSLNNEVSYNEQHHILVKDEQSLLQKDLIVPCKGPCHCGQADVKIPETDRIPKIIESATIEKTPNASCKYCIYGKNCLHTQFHQCETVISCHTLSNISQKHDREDLNIEQLLLSLSNGLWQIEDKFKGIPYPPAHQIVGIPL